MILCYTLFFFFNTLPIPEFLLLTLSSPLSFLQLYFWLLVAWPYFWIVRVVFFHTSDLSQIHEVTFKVARFSYGKVWTLASTGIVAQIKDTVPFWEESLTKLSFALKSSHRKDVFFSLNQITT